MENAYRLQVAAPPVDGKANEACLAFLADTAGVAKSRARIVSGSTSRMKVVQIEGISQAEMERRLESHERGKSTGQNGYRTD